jgi:hypothetical protein
MVVERLRGYYFERGIDIFKINVLVPGLARQMLFECGRKDEGSFAPVTVIEKVHPIEHESVPIALLGMKPGVVGRMVRWAWVDPCNRDITHWRRIQECFDN